MTTATLTKKQAEIEERIINFFAEEKELSNKKIEPITDGVADIQAYIKTNPKIMWIMKESYDDIKNNKPFGGGYSIVKNIFSGDPNIDFGAKRFEKDIKKTLWKKIIYTSFGIHKGESSYKFIENTFCNGSKIDSMKKEIQNIAYINVNKMPGLKNTNMNKLRANFEKYWCNIVYEQISIYEPDIIIFGKTFSLFEKYFEQIKFEKTYSNGLTNSYKYDNKILIDAYHPSYWVISEKDYVNSIIKAYMKLK